MVHPDGDRHHFPAVLLTELSPVHDRLVVQMSVRKLHIQRVVGDPRNERCVEPVRMAGRIEMILGMCLGIFNVPLAGGVEGGIFGNIFSVHRRAGLGDLVEDVLARVDAVIDDDLVALPKVRHPVVLLRVHHLRQQVEEVDVELRARSFGIFIKLGDIDSAGDRHGASRYLGETFVNAFSVVGVKV